MRTRLIVMSACLTLIAPLRNPAAADPAFKVQIISTRSDTWWARALADINGDGLLDIALQNNNARGGWLGWLETQPDLKSWKQHIIAETGRRNFRMRRSRGRRYRQRR